MALCVAASPAYRQKLQLCLCRRPQVHWKRLTFICDTGFGLPCTSPVTVPLEVFSTCPTTPNLLASSIVPALKNTPCTCDTAGIFSLHMLRETPTAECMQDCLALTDRLQPTRYLAKHLEVERAVCHGSHSLSSAARRRPCEKLTALNRGRSEQH